MLLTRTFGNVCNTTMSVTMLSRKAHKPKSHFIYPLLSFCKERLRDSKRGIAADASTTKQDLLVDYLDGDNSGVVVFGLNRPAVRNLTIV